MNIFYNILYLIKIFIHQIKKDRKKKIFFFETLINFNYNSFDSKNSKY